MNEAKVRKAAETAIEVATNGPVPPNMEVTVFSRVFDALLLCDSSPPSTPLANYQDGGENNSE